MSHLSNAREAKEFLVAKIVEEAQRENVTLSEIEQKMLYFTETGWTLPDMMEINSQFDEQYDQAQYENKIVQLITNAVRRMRKENSEEYKDWLSATRIVGKEDHYISVMTSKAVEEYGDTRPPGDNWRLLGTALLIVGSLLTGVFVIFSFNLQTYFPSGKTFATYIWPVLILAAILPSIIRAFSRFKSNSKSTK